MNESELKALFDSHYQQLLANGMDPNAAVAASIEHIKLLAGGTTQPPTPPPSESLPPPPACPLDLESPTKAASSDSRMQDVVQPKTKTQEPLDMALVERYLAEGEATGKFSALNSMLYSVLSNSEDLNRCFWRRKSDGQTEESSPYNYFGVDIKRAKQVFERVINSGKTSVLNTMKNALLALVSQSWFVCKNWSSLHHLRQFIIVLEHPWINDPDCLGILGGICKLYYFLPSHQRNAFYELFRYSYDSKHRLELLHTLQQFITLRLYSGEGFDLVFGAASLMSVLNELNNTSDYEFVSYEEFYNDVVNSEINLVKDYVNSSIYIKRQQHRQRALNRQDSTEESLSFGNGSGQAEEVSRREETGADTSSSSKTPPRELGELSFCDFPFLLDPGSKARILQIDSDYQQRTEVQDSLNVFRTRLSNRLDSSPYLILRVRRSEIVSDTLRQLAQITDFSEYKKPLKVKFQGEEGIDEGGVQKEFFQVILRQLLDFQFGMFTYDEETHTLWFNSDSLEATMEYELIGVLLGIAIYNGIILDLHFPPVLYKKLMIKDIAYTLKDLAFAKPELSRGLQQLLDFKEQGDSTVENVYQRCFEISYEVFGHIKTIELKPNGSTIPVTCQNRKEYVDLYISYVLEKSVQRQYNAFHKGFHMVVGNETMRLFRWEEIELLICGNPELDFEALEQVTQYEDGFDENSRCIKDFWSVVHLFSLEEKKKLLKFCTGSDRVPIRGLSTMTFVISRNGPDSNRLPTAHTCFNHLLLPDYVSRERLKERLLLAVNQSEGFGLL